MPLVRPPVWENQQGPGIFDTLFLATDSKLLICVCFPAHGRTSFSGNRRMMECSVHTSVAPAVASRRRLRRARQKDRRSATRLCMHGSDTKRKEFDISTERLIATFSNQEGQFTSRAARSSNCTRELNGTLRRPGKVQYGNLALCTNEGQAVNVSGITDDPCINCYCKVSSGCITLSVLFTVMALTTVHQFRLLYDCISVVYSDVTDDRDQFRLYDCSSAVVNHSEGQSSFSETFFLVVGTYIVFPSSKSLCCVDCRMPPKVDFCCNVCPSLVSQAPVEARETLAS
ncbi:hypothetical protein RRG08_034684 [Elysia crispata]|uniref:Uncharacterized protein n=1 Tax=Elysia crispata TaxID=231223 RepID=A0AAE0Z2B9_9GAST|nr:hypothetical protein RRG08_034684 [Elysia crispata]